MNKILSGVIVEESAILEDEIEIGYNSVVLSGATTPEITRICRGAIIGSNVTIYQGVTIGQRAVVSPGSVVKHSIPPLAIVDGNPATIKGYIDTPSKGFEVGRVSPNRARETQSTLVRGVTIHNLANIPDLRGSLSVGEFNRQIPFIPKRYFLVFDVPTAETRGEHAHINCHQFLIAVKGAVSVIADDGEQREEITLNHPALGLYLPPMTWGIQYRYTSDAVLLVFASDYYDPADYIRDYQQFLNACNAKSSGNDKR